MKQNYQIENRIVADSEWKAEATPVQYCEECKEGIFDGNYAYHFDGVWFHEDCFQNFVNREFKREVIKGGI